MSLGDDLPSLISAPRESLNIEIKEWLDLSEREHRALLAKEIIALANHGGGFVVVGFKELEDGTFASAPNRPQDLAAWSQDKIQGIVAKYIDPKIQCQVSHVSEFEKGEKYPIIVVPGGHRVPIKAKAGSPDGRKLQSNRIYIRRPGPCSEEPKDAVEWDKFLERCLQNRKAELLESFRTIMAGELPTADSSDTNRLGELQSFRDDASALWDQAVATLPHDAPPRLHHGHYECAFAFDGDFDRKSLKELLETIRSATRNHSGWPPFCLIERRPYTPAPVNGAIQTWFGPDVDGSYANADQHDFWRISPNGLLFIKRGFTEDCYRPLEPGEFFDIKLPIKRLGEAILQVVYLAQALNAIDADLICQCSWKGLSGRRLYSESSIDRSMLERYSASQDSYEAVKVVPIRNLPDALPELVFEILSPLYELFNFFNLPKRLVEQELEKLRRQSY